MNLEERLKQPQKTQFNFRKGGGDTTSRKTESAPKSPQ